MSRHYPFYLPTLPIVCAVSLAGLPAVSLPVGRSEGLPVGAQLIAPSFEDERLLAAAAAIERAIPAEAEVRP